MVPWLFQPTDECETSWVSWRASSALTPFWCLIPVIDSWFITSYFVGQNVVWVGTVDRQHFWTWFHPKWLLKWRQKTWSPSSQTLPKPRWSFKIFRTPPYKIPTSLSICRTSLVDLPSSVFQQHGNNHQWSPQLAASMVVIFHQCSATFKFSDPAGDGCKQWGTVPVNICQTFMKVVGRLLF